MKLKKQKIRIKELLRNGTFILTEDFTPCDIRAYSIDTVVTTEDLWEIHKLDVICNCNPAFTLITI